MTIDLKFTRPMHRSTTQILTNTRALLQHPQDWTQWQIEDPDTGALCLYGALLKGDHGTATWEQVDSPELTKANAIVIRLCRNHLQASGDLPAMDAIGTFNNHPRMRHQDILTLLDEAIEISIAQHEARVLIEA